MQYGQHRQHQQLRGAAHMVAVMGGGGAPVMPLAVPVRGAPQMLPHTHALGVGGAGAGEYMAAHMAQSTGVGMLGRGGRAAGRGGNGNMYKNAEKAQMMQGAIGLGLGVGEYGVALGVPGHMKMRINVMDQGNMHGW